MILVTGLLALCAAPLAQETVVSAPIAEVTVFPASALVRRRVELPAGSGRFVFKGLPATLDADTLRVRCAGAEVLGTEARERLEPRVPEARVEELRTLERQLQRELEVARDDLERLRTLEAHLDRLLELASAKPGQAPPAGTAEAWARHAEQVGAEFAANRAAQREQRWRVEDLRARLSAVTDELGAAGSQGSVRLRDVLVELGGSGGPATLDLEYLVPDAGWEPRYDLRTASDARSVELGYRAEVRQQTGEDWTEVELALSTAQPHLGAQGPDPEPVWLSYHSRQESWERSKAGDDRESLGRRAKDLRDAQNDEDDSRATHAAAVESQGLSLRFRLATRETIPTRREPSDVLIGSQRLDVTPEYFCAPQLDTNVWLRGRTINASPWTLLPGRAATYFGADFLGYSRLASVQPGAEFVLHLGPDPALSVERKQLEDVTSGPGVFSSKATCKQSFRLRLTNHGAAVTRADGAALVFVREVQPRSTDERIKVELSDVSAKPSDEPRWKKEREERGIVTWALTVPASGESVLQWMLKTSYPDGATVVEGRRE